ncbi:hypothetical protein, partial [Xylanibacter rodentium]|uniref:hypothetical protein n=1 Tax=Xylanibacter rodentium TaxID=2736289 RepID=UPI002586AA3F
GRLALQEGRRRNAITALLQGQTALSAFLTKPLGCNMLIISTSHLTRKSRFSGALLRNTIVMSFNTC